MSAWDEARLKPHGTTAAYRRHLRRGQKPCGSCRQAEARRCADRHQPAECACGCGQMTSGYGACRPGHYLRREVAA